jgi:hypothetical protein
MTGRLGDTTRVPDLVLEQHRLGELEPGEAARLARRLEQEDELRERLAELDRSDEDLRRRYPPEWLAQRVRERLESGCSRADRAPRLRRRRAPVLAALAAAALVVLVLDTRLAEPPPARRDSPASASGDRLKGSRPGLALFRRTPDGSEPLTDGAFVRTGDLVRVGYRAAGRSFGAILSIDGRGLVSMHLPKAGDRAAALARGGLVLLDFSYELDDAPRWEAFYFVTGEMPFDVTGVVRAARSAAAGAAGTAPPVLALPAGLEQSLFILKKEARP